MARILAIDYGQKRVGVAVTDENAIIATPVTTIPSAQAIDWIMNYIEKEDVGTIVVGKAVDMKGNASDASRFIEPFVNRLRKVLLSKGIDIVRMDERFTSVMAHRAIIEAGSSNKIRKDKGIVDKISATIILQSYLQMKNYNN